MQREVVRIDPELTQIVVAPLNPTTVVFLIGVGVFSLSTVFSIATGFSLIVSGIVNGICLYSLYTVTHDAVHRLAHHNTRVNDWMGRVAAILEGMTFPMFRIVHLQHHAFTNHPDRDPDYLIGRRPRWLLPIWTVLRLTYDNFFMLRQRLWSSVRHGFYEHLLTVGFQVGIVIGAIVLGYSKEIFYLWIIPLALSGTILELTVAWLVHYPHESRRPLENTRMFPGLLWQLLTFNQNYHLVHHLWPNIPWFRYPLAAKVVENNFKKPRSLATS